MKPAPLDKRLEAVEKAAARQKPASIAAEVGVHVSTVYHWMERADVKPLRPRPYPPRVRRSALRRLAKGEQADLVAERLGVHVSTVRLWRRQAQRTSP